MFLVILIVIEEPFSHVYSHFASLQSVREFILNLVEIMLLCGYDNHFYPFFIFSSANLFPLVPARFFRAQLPRAYMKNEDYPDG